MHTDRYTDKQRDRDSMNRDRYADRHRDRKTMSTDRCADIQRKRKTMMAIITGALEGLRGRTVEAHSPDGGGEDPPARDHEEGQ